MAHKPGLPTVPRGLPPALTSYLQSLDAAIRRIVGQARGTEAVSTERGTSGVPIRSTVTSEALATGSVSTDKMANASVTTEKIAKGAVTGERLGDQSVASTHLTKGCVTTEKIADGVLPTVVDGEAVDGDEVQLPGKWLSKPNVMLSFVSSVQADTGAFGATDLQEILDEDGKDTGAWKFTAAGNFTWLAVGNEQ